MVLKSGFELAAFLYPKKPVQRLPEAEENCGEKREGKGLDFEAEIEYNRYVIVRGRQLGGFLLPKRNQMSPHAIDLL